MVIVIILSRIYTLQGCVVVYCFKEKFTGVLRAVKKGIVTFIAFKRQTF